MDISTSSKNRVLHQTVLGSRRFSNFFWATMVSLGAGGFLLAGISSYFRVNLLPFTDATQILFFPQGITMGFYGLVGLAVAFYLWATIFLDVGGGYNEFNQETGKVHIFRWGFWGKNRRVEISQSLEEVQSIRVDIKEGFNPRRALYLSSKQQRDIPLTRVGQPLSLAEIENQGAELARFLGVPLEGL
ncbi:MAG: photosystem I assembly protein Ycf4 [Cyanothece sp. SIO1E1]|nr:photosystem I assembly protein Ycf4 [Cyanothece sp. SIO1E1]